MGPESGAKICKVATESGVEMCKIASKSGDISFRIKKEVLC